MSTTKAKNSDEAVNSVKASQSQLSDFQKSVFSSDEFASMSEKFDTTPDIVKTALRLAGVNRTTFFEAEKIVKKFKTKEVI